MSFESSPSAAHSSIISDEKKDAPKVHERVTMRFI